MNIYANFYVYSYLRKDGTPYYIGKGTKNRAWIKHSNISKPKNRNLIVIVESNLSEIGAFALERRMIRWYGRKDLGTGILRNKTEGGEGPSEGDRKGINNPMYGRTHSVSTKQKISISSTGIKKSKQSVLRRLESITGMYAGENNPMYGKIHTDIARQKMSAAAKNKQKIQCHHCNKLVSANNYHRWHGDQCKFR